VNFDQYRALAEGFSSHMWDWYTGTIIWKTQNPWTALRGQMYDYYLDVNACLYGLHHGSEPLHIMYDQVSGMTMIVNNTFRTQRDLMMQVRVYDMDGKDRLLTQQFYEVGPTVAKNYIPMGRGIDALRRKEGIFLSLRLVNTRQQVVSDNLYWLPDSAGMYSGLQRMGKAALSVEARSAGKPSAAEGAQEMQRPGAGQQRIIVTLRNPAGGPVAFSTGYRWWTRAQNNGSYRSSIVIIIFPYCPGKARPLPWIIRRLPVQLRRWYQSGDGM
jgi:mannosylglycoprotein endo-beta-mannosidase